MLIASFIVIALISYLLGSLNFGVILSRKIENDDVRNYGSGNAGTTNMLRKYGKKAAFFTIVGDMLKVFAAIFIAIQIITYTPMLMSEINSSPLGEIDVNMFIKSFSGFFCVLGHIYPCYFKFKGGKGVATSGGMVFAIDWRIGLILLAVLMIIVAVTRYVSLGSIIIALFYPVLIFLLHRSIALTIIASVFTVIVIVAHRENIKKLINHTENKIDFKSNKKDSD